MYQRILIATDGSTLSRKAVDSGIEMAELTGAQIVALKVVPRYPVSYFEGGVALPLNNVAAIEKQWAPVSSAISMPLSTALRERVDPSVAIKMRWYMVCSCS